MGDQIVFKRYGDRTIVSKMPDMSRVKKSVKQQAENNKFREAALYARTQMANPTSKAEYTTRIKGMQRAYNIAIADFYTPPEIKKVDTREFFKSKKLTINAVDDFKVVKVSVEIYDSNDTLIERGDALELAEFLWEYALTKEYKSEEPYKLAITAWDKPGNTAVFKTEISNN
ncbi:MAG: hypothetical protein HC905_04345 [Bacteroidales bacterium]|nr:hypothetical protein [Bacteroidales bacterium]